MSGPRFDTVLVANRGEIAVRVLRTARTLGYRTVAVFSDADRDAPHVRAADEATRIGPAPAASSYLLIDRIVAAAQAAGAGAIHPGYGFLAESPALATACTDAGIVFVGPPADAIRLMADKATAKRRVAAAGVPVLPGYEGDDQTDDRLVDEAVRVGFPLMVKAAAGGGGKGMRLVRSPEELPGALAAARREAAGAFGDEALILERALLGPRHVEVQVLADETGDTIALGERDCSVQRRHQKVIEEAPSPAVDAPTRARMQEAAVTAARDVGYVGAGTVEFLLDRDGTFAFLEMNTRLQVEHPVTEMVTGVDLVAWQLRIAQGEPLTLRQEDVRLDGHAIEVRLYAEDPGRGHLPQTGRIVAWDPPTGEHVRVDAGIATGTAVTSHYDPLLAKVIAHGRDRDEARRRLADALDRTTLLGVRSNRTFLAAILRDRVFADGGATTAFLDGWSPPPRAVTTRDLAIVAASGHLAARGAASARSPGLGGWTNAPWLRSRRRLKVEDEEIEVELRDAGPDVLVRIGDDDIRISSGAVGLVDGAHVDLTEHRADERVWVRFRDLDLVIDDVTHAPAALSETGGAGVLTAPMHGTVTAALVAPGDVVAVGQPVLVLEAMKMEHVVRADVDGRVVERADLGAQVADRDVVARIVTGEGPS